MAWILLEKNINLIQKLLDLKVHEKLQLILECVKSFLVLPNSTAIELSIKGVTIGENKQEESCLPHLSFHMIQIRANLSS